jgi:hypothetical protein
MFAMPFSSDYSMWQLSWAMEEEEALALARAPAKLRDAALEVGRDGEIERGKREKERVGSRRRARQARDAALSRAHTQTTHASLILAPPSLAPPLPPPAQSAPHPTPHTRMPTELHA